MQQTRVIPSVPAPLSVCAWGVCQIPLGTLGNSDVALTLKASADVGEKQIIMSQWFVQQWRFTPAVCRRWEREQLSILGDSLKINEEVMEREGCPC